MRSRSLLAILLVAAAALTSAAWLRSAEYDEQYTLFVTGGVARPVWSTDAFPAGEVRELQAAHAGFAAIAHDLRVTDVHPPLYFWLAAVWRGVVGNGLFAARLASVLCSIATLCVVAVIARLSAIPAVLAVLLTLGCYGFVYTGSIARGFALAQLLTMSGVALLLLAKERKQMVPALAAGVLFGAATFTNYLAVFSVMGALLWFASPVMAGLFRAIRSGTASGRLAETNPAMTTRAWHLAAACAGFAAWLPADVWFYLAQRQSRMGQFASFDAVSGVIRLAEYTAANLLGGLPWYLDGAARTAAYLALAMVLAGLLTLTVWRWRYISTPGSRLLFAMAVAAPPTGLLALGFVFNNTPIELRYLSYCMPFLGLLLAGMFAALPRRAGRAASAAVLVIQAMALIGLMTRPETMQPARATAIAAASLVRDGVVMLPHGNDGVGIVGAFAIESPTSMRLLIVGKDESLGEIRARADYFPRVVLALVGQDADSRATLPAMRAAFAHPCWNQSGEGFNVLAFNRVCVLSRR